MYDVTIAANIDFFRRRHQPLVHGYELADACGITPETYSRIMRGGGEGFNVKHLRAIAKALQIRMSDLVSDVK